MKHSDYNAVFNSLKELERNEFIEAIKKHGGEYRFVEPDYDDSDYDEFAPTIYVNGGSQLHDQPTFELRVHFVTYEEGIVKVYGRDFYTNTLSYSCDHQIEFGSYHEMMDYMDDPDED